MSGLFLSTPELPFFGSVGSSGQCCETSINHTPRCVTEWP